MPEWRLADFKAAYHEKFRAGTNGKHGIKIKILQTLFANLIRRYPLLEYVFSKAGKQKSPYDKYAELFKFPENSYLKTKLFKFTLCGGGGGNLFFTVFI